MLSTARFAVPIALAMLSLATAAEPKNQKPKRILGDLLNQPADSMARFDKSIDRLKIDEAQAAAASIRKLPGKWITLYTDLPKNAEIDGLPQVFDAAVPQYCQYFGIDPATLGDWSMTGCVMKDREKFRQAGLLPADLPNFQHGYARNFDLWLDEQPSEYYRRHLLIHEGVHGFMNTKLGSCGPPWFMEGLAELLGTHRWRGGQLTLGYMPHAKDETPEWGRIKIIKDDLAAKRAKKLQSVVELAPMAYLENDAYAWSWAAATFLDGHPRYRDRFRSLTKHVLDPAFQERFRQLFEKDWQELNEEWQLFVSNIEYGYDVARNAVTFAAGKPLASTAAATIAADRGWQSSGWAVAAGKKYTIKATGRYQVGNVPKPWPCEPGGVSIRYWQGRPLGQLLMATRPDDPAPNGLTALLKPPVAVGLGTSFTAEQSGTLYFKINESPSEWSDNAGSLQVAIQAE